MSSSASPGPATRAHALGLLRRALADPAADFREGQWEAIDAAVNRGERQLVVQRTGWGKSIVYFLASKLLRERGKGPSLIVSPLRALMRNQVEAAATLGVRAVSINSDNRGAWPGIMAEVRSGKADALLVSPERLENEQFVAEVLQPIAISICLLVVDEVHCISDWGHDFRPDYRRLASVMKRLPRGTPLLGTTATANDRVLQDIEAQLGKLTIRRGPLLRKSLALDTVALAGRAERLAWLAEQVPKLRGTGIIYVLTQHDAELVASWLQARGVDAHAYHSDVSHPDFADEGSYRAHLEQRLMNDDIKALVATIGLGMGYDKKNIEFVIHFQAPGSIITYYQQVGRAGRAIDRALGIMMTGTEDGRIHEFFRRNAFPGQQEIDEILSALESSDGLTGLDLQRMINLTHDQIDHVLKFLAVESPSPVRKEGSKWIRTPVRYALDAGKIARLTAQRELEWQRVMQYASESGCLMAFLACELDDLTAEACGRCSRCAEQAPVPHSVSTEMVRHAREFVRRSPLKIRPRVRIPQDAFPVYGWRGNFPTAIRNEEGRALSSWGVDELGELAKSGKQAGSFGPELVSAAGELIARFWRPSPAPEWVTCVPSARHSDLVPAFARALAGALGLPFRRVVELARPTEPQKAQNNGFHRCANLDGAFRIVDSVPRSPVLLVDDMVDSGWTFAVLGRLLREAGSGPVFPLALARAGAGD